MDELITIIVPVYNIENYITRCIESVINQTYKNLEIILVDDGSKDNSGKICDEYEKKDERIRVIHKINGGLSDARNAGIEQARGILITFLDGDDYIEENHIEYLYNMLIKYNADISVCQFKIIYENEEEKILKLKKNKERVLDNVKALEIMLYNKRFCNSTCTKLYKKELFDNIQFPKGKLYEDLGTTYKLIEKCKKLVYGNLQTYNYLINRKDSIINRKFDERRMEAIEFAKEILEFVENKYPNIKKAAIARLYMECIFTIVQIDEEEKYKENIEEIYKYLNMYRVNILLNNKIQIKFKLFAIYSIFGIKPIKHLWNIKNNVKRIIGR